MIKITIISLNKIQLKLILHACIDKVMACTDIKSLVLLLICNSEVIKKAQLGKGMFVAIKRCLCFSPFKEKHSVTSGTHLQIHNKPLTNTPTNVSDAH